MMTDNIIKKNFPYPDVILQKEINELGILFYNNNNNVEAIFLIIIKSNIRVISIFLFRCGIIIELINNQKIDSILILIVDRNRKIILN
jgi:hypothetical protein